MSLRNFTWNQVAVLALCLGSAFAAHKYLGASEGMAAGVVASVLAFFMGRDPVEPPSPPSAPGAQ